MAFNNLCQIGMVEFGVKMALAMVRDGLIEVVLKKAGILCIFSLVRKKYAIGAPFAMTGLDAENRIVAGFNAWRQALVKMAV